MKDKPLANPLIVLREEFDDWAILFDPDQGNAYGLNPISVFIWQHLDGKHNVDDIVAELQAQYTEVPAEADGACPGIYRPSDEQGSGRL